MVKYINNNFIYQGERGSLVELTAFCNVIVAGFVVCLMMAPRRGPAFGEKFIAYIVALLLGLMVTADVFVLKPNAFFFMLGGAGAFVFVLVRRGVRITVNK